MKRSKPKSIVTPEKLSRRSVSHSSILVLSNSEELAKDSRMAAEPDSVIVIEEGSRLCLMSKKVLMFKKAYMSKKVLQSSSTPLSLSGM